MESAEQKSSKKKIASVAGVIVIIGAAAGLYFSGLIPGFGEGAKVASQLKTEIEALKGNNIQSKLVQLIENSQAGIGGQQEKLKQIIDAFNSSANLSLEYADLKTSSGNGKGTVTIISPKITLQSKNDMSKKGEVDAEKFVISRDVADKNHYFFHSEGNIDVYGNVAGTNTKFFSISGEEPSNEIKLNDAGALIYSTSSIKNVKFIEGRGNTTFITIGEISSVTNRNDQNGKMDDSMKVTYKNIIPGDMIKLMVGNIDPLTFNFDYSYKGDDFRNSLQEIMEYPQKKKAEEVKMAADPNYKPQEVEKPTIKPFDGIFKLADFSILMGDAGIVINADLTFKKDTPKAIPTGTVNVKIEQYQKLIDYSKKFYMGSPDKLNKTISFLGEVGDNSGGNIAINVKLDGTDNVLIGGKTLDQIKVIGQKYYPPVTPVNNIPQPGSQLQSTYAPAPAAPATPAAPGAAVTPAPVPTIHVPATLPPVQAKPADNSTRI